MSELLKSKFETILQIRPDDIDMNQHVHSSKYMDYVLAARFDQMTRCYKMPMSEFMKHGYGWVIKDTYMSFKRPLLLGDEIKVQTHIEEMYKDGVKVQFEIFKTANNKLSCSGYFNYTMVDFKTRRAAIIPDWIIERYSI